MRELLEEVLSQLRELLTEMGHDPNLCVCSNCLLVQRMQDTMSRPVTLSEAVLAFHIKMGFEKSMSACEMYDVSNITDEIVELSEAIGRKDRVEIADAAADIVYLTIGTCVRLDIPFEDVFHEIHRSNMTKDPNHPNKRFKGPEYERPILRDIV